MHKEVPSPSAVLNKSVSLIEYVHARHEHRTGVYSTLQNSARKNSSGHTAFLGCMALPQNDSDECKADMENLKLRLDTLNREVKRIEAQLKQGESLSKCIMVEDSADQRLLSLLHTHMHMTWNPNLPNNILGEIFRHVECSAARDSLALASVEWSHIRRWSKLNRCCCSGCGGYCCKCHRWTSSNPEPDTSWIGEPSYFSSDDDEYVPLSPDYTPNEYSP